MIISVVGEAIIDEKTRKKEQKEPTKKQIHSPFMRANSKVFGMLIVSINLFSVCLPNHYKYLPPANSKQQVNAEKQIMFVLKLKLNIYIFFLDAKTSKRVAGVKQQLSQYFWQLRLEERCGLAS